MVVWPSVTVTLEKKLRQMSIPFSINNHLGLKINNASTNTNIKVKRNNWIVGFNVTKILHTNPHFDDISPEKEQRKNFVICWPYDIR